MREMLKKVWFEPGSDRFSPITHSLNLDPDLRFGSGRFRFELRFRTEHWHHYCTNHTDELGVIL